MQGVQMSVGSVSVIVLHCNRPELVHQALLSIHDQTVQPAEILLVDDGSTEDNRSKLQTLSSLATIVYMPRRVGPSIARNIGVEHASSEWVAFLDDDDLYYPDKLERQIRFLESHPHVVALGGACKMITADGIEETWGRQGPPRQLTLADALCNTASMSQALMIRRDTFLALGGFSPDIVHMEDFEFGIRLLASGAPVFYLGEPLFIYHRGGRAQLTAQWGKMLKAELGILQLHADLVRREFGPLGLTRLRARCCKKLGRWKGGFIGRSVWAAACVAEAAMGAISDRRPADKGA
jgi:glycosyltransferase involved in cell wall biosynthesis